MIAKASAFSVRFHTVLLILSLCITVLLQSGCWNRQEVNDLAIITAAAIDQKGDKVELSVQLFITRAAAGGQLGMAGGGSASGQNQTIVRSAEGVTIADAMARLQEQISRQIFWGHTDVFIFGEKLARKGLRDHIDFFGRHPQVRLRSYVFVSKGAAKDILEMQPPMERSSAESLRELAVAGVMMNVSLNDLLQKLVGDAGATAIPSVEKAPPLNGEEKQTIPYISGTAVFKKDKMVSRIDSRKTRGILWVKNEIRSAVITVSPEQDKGVMSFEVLRAKTKLLPEIKDGSWKITIKLEAEYDLIQNSTNLNMMNPEFVKMMEKILNQDLENHIKKTLNLLQTEIKADIVGFADAFHSKYPKEWNKVKYRWDEIFPEVEVQIHANVKIKRPGKSTLPQGVPEKEVKLR